MCADQVRNRTVGCKMTDSEHERLSAVAEGDGMSAGTTNPFWEDGMTLSCSLSPHTGAYKTTPSRAPPRLTPPARSPSHLSAPHPTQWRAEILPSPNNPSTKLSFPS
jgi:hypothetical protein